MSDQPSNSTPASASAPTPQDLPIPAASTSLPQTKLTEGESPNLMDAAAERLHRAIHTLFSTYPYMSYGMVQIGLGPAVPPVMFRPVLERMIELGEIKTQRVNRMTGYGQLREVLIYCLPQYTYPPLSDSEIEALKSQIPAPPEQANQEDEAAGE